MDERGWLIEIGPTNATPPLYWSGGAEGVGNWTVDSLKALRFAREQDAKAFIAWQWGRGGYPGAKAMEHMWPAPAVCWACVRPNYQHDPALHAAGCPSAPEANRCCDCGHSHVPSPLSRQRASHPLQQPTHDGAVDSCCTFGCKCPRFRRARVTDATHRGRSSVPRPGRVEHAAGHGKGE